MGPAEATQNKPPIKQAFEGTQSSSLLYSSNNYNKYLGTEFNELERSLNYRQLVQIRNHRFESSQIFNYESVIQDFNQQ